MRVYVSELQQSLLLTEYQPEFSLELSRTLIHMFTSNPSLNYEEDNIQKHFSFLFFFSYCWNSSFK